MEQQRTQHPPQRDQRSQQEQQRNGTQQTPSEPSGEHRGKTQAEIEREKERNGQLGQTNAEAERAIRERRRGGDAGQSGQRDDQRPASDRGTKQ